MQNQFQNFPPDIWASVCVYLAGEQIGRLKLTGSKILWHKLSRTRVVAIIAVGKDFLNFKRWPAFLNELPSISELSIDNRNIEWWRLWSPSLANVPLTLRKLKIRGHFEYVRSFFFSDGHDLKKYVPNLEELDTNLGLSQIWPFGTTPSNLTKLTCVASPLAWGRGLHFPDTLLSLNIGQLTGFSTRIVLPPKLETLIIVATSSSQRNNIQSLHPSVRTIIVEANILLHLNELPRELETLSIRAPLLQTPPEYLTEDWRRSNMPIGLHPQSWNFLPALTSLTLTDISNEGCLPIHKGTHTFAWQPIHLLPRSITKLSLSFDHFTFIEGTPSQQSTSKADSALFPPDLCSLSLRNAHLTASATRQLPDSLRHLSIHFLSQEICCNLPSRLIELTTVSTFASATLINALPKSLTSFTTSGSARWTDLSTYFRLFIGEEEYFESLKDEKMVWNLPTHLTHLKLLGFPLLGDNLSYQTLSSLSYLDLRNSTQISDLSIPLLSPHLTFLNLEFASMVTGRCFEHLPRTLTILNLNASTSIADTDIVHLPRMLEYLYISNAVQLSDLCIKDLPKRLIQVNLGHNSILTENAYLELSPLLKSMNSQVSFKTARWYVDRGRLEVRKMLVRYPENPSGCSVQ